MLRKIFDFLRRRCRKSTDALSEEEKLRIDMTQRCRCLDKRMW
jgi:hypothetical protein